MKKSIILAGLAFFLCLLTCNIFGQTPAQKDIEAKWLKYGLYQPDIEFPASNKLLKIKGYELTKTKAVGLALVAIGGITNGMLQGYEFDGRMSFERKYNVDPRGYWGSQSWARRYRDFNPAHGLAHPAYKHLPVFDFYHTAQIIHHHSLVTGGIIVGISSAYTNKKWWHYGLDLAASTFINSASQSIGLRWIRK
jgi:hypothetical protein